MSLNVPAELIQNVLDQMKNDYVEFSTWLYGENVEGRNKAINDYKLGYIVGPTYIKLVKYNHADEPECTVGFVANKDVKGFKTGDLLKSASWKAPALNKARGSVFDSKSYQNIKWTGVS